MKKICYALAALAAMAAVSCQEKDVNTENGGSSKPGTLTATFASSATKVTYTEIGEKNNLQPAWEVDDEIIGFNDAEETYTFTVTEVKYATATLSADKPVTDGTYHLIYKSGAKATDIKNKSLAVSYDKQKGDKTMPAVMLATGEVSGGSCNFEFSNAGAIIGISNANGVPAESTISEVTISGNYLSEGTISINNDNDELVLTAEDSDPWSEDIISAEILSDIAVGENGALSKKILIAVPCGAEIVKVTLTVDTDKYSYTLPEPKECKANDYLYVKNQQFTEDVNLPEGALRGAFSVSSSKKVYFSKGNLYWDGDTYEFENKQYDFTDSWKPNYVSHLFWISNTSSDKPYSDTYKESGYLYDILFTNADECLPNASFTVKGVTGKYRTLSKDEWIYLFESRTNAAAKFGYATVEVDEEESVHGIIILPDTFTDPKKNNGSGAFVQQSTKVGWDANVYATGDDWEAMEAAGAVFLPAAGKRDSKNLADNGNCGYYWSSPSSSNNSARFMHFQSNKVTPNDDFGERKYGYSIRLVTEPIK